mgnify:CR=1 FL=1
MKTKPYVSVGMPVLNGENYLSVALDSLLGQTFEDFELIICDNGSTDRTQEICRAYEARDARIRYYRNDQNIGGAANYNRVLHLSSGKYFKWMAHDDACSPRFLESCVDMLDRDSSVVLCFTHTRYIDALGGKLRDISSPLNFHSTSPHVRFASIISVSYRKHGCTEVFGLHRSEILKRVSLPPYTHGDRIMLAALSLYGRFQEIPECLFCKREHGERTIRDPTGTNGSARRGLGRWIGYGPLPRIEWYDPSMKGRIVFPEFRRILEQHAAIRKAPLSVSERVWCYTRLADGFARNSAFASRDVILALEAGIRRLWPSGNGPDIELGRAKAMRSPENKASTK